jgi:hypothetical protein
VAFGQAHAECQKPVTVKLPDGTYRIREPCRDPQGGGGKWETTTRVYKIISDTEFSMTGKYGEFRSRYCPQSDLPEPWKTADRAKSAK